MATKYILPFAVLVPVLLLACGGGESTSDGVATGEITVFAAASLTDAFMDIGDKFEAANQGVHVTFNFAGSQELRTQLEQGARADLFASADNRQMDMAVASGVAVEPRREFARNRLVVIVPKANEAGLTTLHDLANDGVKVVLANADVPAGRYSRQVLDTASADPAYSPDFSDKVLANLVSEETNVKQVATKVQLDEADAGIVYSSDVTPELASDVTKVDIPDALNVLASYPIALTPEADMAVAEAFIDFVISAEGHRVLAEHGFLSID